MPKNVTLMLFTAVVAGILGGLLFALVRDAPEAAVPGAAPVRPAVDVGPASLPPEPVEPPRVHAEQAESPGTEEAQEVAPAEPENGAISGTVLDPNGQRVSGAQVLASGRVTVSSVTGEDGHFTLQGLPEGLYTVEASHPEHATSRVEGVQTGAADVKLVLGLFGQVRGEVRDSVTRAPVPEFEVAHTPGKQHLAAPWMMHGFTAFASPEGEFALEALPPGENTLVVKAPGYSASTLLVEVTEGGVTQARIELTPGLIADGVVVNETGEPVSGAMIFAGEVPEPWMRAEAALETTASNGVFHIDTLGREVTTLTAFHEDYVPGSAALSQRQGIAEHIRIVLRAGGQIEGRVTLGGDPAPGVFIMAERLAYEGTGVLSPNKTDSDGRYGISGLEAGEYALRVTLDSGGQHTRTMTRPAIVAPGQTTQVDFDFLGMNSGLEGTVFDNNAPAADAFVAAVVQTAASDERFSALVDPQTGSYHLGPLPAGLAEVTFHVRDRRKMANVQIPEGGVVRLDMTFEGAAGVSGRVRGARPEHVNGVGLLLGEVAMPDGLSGIALMEYARLIVRNVYLDGDGAFDTGQLEPGVYTIVAYSAPQEMTSPEDAARTRYTSEVVTLKAGETVYVDLSLE